MILVYCIPIAILVGLLRGGTFRNYLQHPIRYTLLPVFAFLIEALLGRICHALPIPQNVSLTMCVIVEYALLFAFCLLNRERPSMRWIGIGTALNFLVMTHSGMRMPVSEIVVMKPEFARVAQRIQDGSLVEYMICTVDHPLFCLGDIIYMPFVPNGLGSIGDFLLAIGIIRLLLEIMDVAQSQRTGKRPISTP